MNDHKKGADNSAPIIMHIFALKLPLPQDHIRSDAVLFH